MQEKFKDIKFPVRIRNIHKIEKKNCASIGGFNYENKEKYQIYMLKNTFKGHVDLLTIKAESKRHYIFIKDFNTTIHDHTPHHGSKDCCRYCFQAFSTAEILKSHVNDCLKTNGKQMIKIRKKGKYVRFRIEAKSR